ncbi:hypothetical protein L211DRAFT_193221 [Terfezia boudieri ATCC MYA-4762]|uniref:SH3 domain-containing protein n=1 Tax=Terfezia boudieri ATCC MYA-4762 TaxID=1051890 RepID=A0A3N4LRM5_9PEZI|nr:hypothetical protein L211DRAFT_193221 [Terfezia boudieri ATCC MYA-4762]
MNTVHRSVGRLRKRTEDKPTVGAVVQQCLLTEDFLQKLLANTKAWRDGWSDIITFQYGLSEGYVTLYEPIPMPDGSARRVPVATSRDVMERTEAFVKIMQELKADLLEEVKLVEKTVVDPLTDIKKFMESVNKALKKRDNKKLDYERYYKEVEHLKKKRTRNDRENAVLAKAEANLEAATTIYQNEDERVLEWVPALLDKVEEAISLLLQTLMEGQVQILGRSYTLLVQYAQETGYEQSNMLVEQWEEAFEPIKRQVEENFVMIKQGKAVRMPMNQPAASKSILPLPSNFKKGGPPPPPSQPPSSHTGKPSGRASSTSGDTATERGTVAPRASTSDFSFRSARDESPPPPLPGNKPPPPSESIRPQKSFSNLSVYEGSTKPQPKHLDDSVYVTALYTFQGQAAGDLSFKEGDKIKVTRKTDSVDDWWEGELDGRKGEFPANYTMQQ